MTRVPGPSLDQLDRLADDYAGLLATTLVETAWHSDAQAIDPHSVEELTAIRSIWAMQVDDVLLPALGVGFEVGAATIRVGLREAVGLTAAAFTDVAATSDALAEAYLAQARNRLVRVGDELWGHAREELLEGLRAGESIAELAARVRKVAPDLTEPRASQIARTEVLGACNAGALEQVLATGATGTKTWEAHLDERVRSELEHAVVQTVGLREKFTVGGFPADRPHDPTLPPHLSVSCRCALSFELDLEGGGPAGLPTGPPAGEPPTVLHEDDDSAGVRQRQERDRSFLARVFADGLAALVTWFKARTAAATLPEREFDEGGDVTAAATEPTVATTSQEGAWEGVLVVEGIATGDGRQFASGALTWAELPLPLKWQEAEQEGHTGAVIVGRIDAIERQGDRLVGRGVFDLDGDHGREAHRLVSGGYMRGVSIAPDDISDSDVELVFADGQDDQGDPFARPELVVFNAGRVRSATLCAEAAFVEAEVRLTGVEAMPMVAAAHTITIPDVPPAWWFEEPGEESFIGAVTVTDEGRVFGQLGPARVAHRGWRRNGQFVYVPKGNVDYGKFMNKTALVLAADGKVERIPAGNVTADCNHGPLHSAAAAREHYENSCSIMARIRVGENEHGVWVAGALLHDVTPAQVSRMFACALSGHWDSHETRAGWQELTAALLVPAEGFPKEQKATVRVRDGQLVASAVPIRHGSCDCSLAASATPSERPDLSRVKERIAATVGRDRRSRRERAAARVRARG